MSKELEKKINELDEEAAVYVISVAAELSGLHPQTLRQYDRLGLVSPGRTSGRNRRYSLRDIALLRNVTKLVDEGINHVGIKRIIELESAMANLSIEVAKLRIEVDELLRKDSEVIIYKEENQFYSSSRKVNFQPEYLESIQRQLRRHLGNLKLSASHL